MVQRPGRCAVGGFAEVSGAREGEQSDMNESRWIEESTGGRKPVRGVAEGERRADGAAWGWSGGAVAEESKRLKG